MVATGNPASISDVGVGALCSHTAIHGAYLNVMINCQDFDDKGFVAEITEKAKSLLAKSESKQKELLQKTEEIITA
jgi:glutamate formiminotransferase/formiminotetrahydrofolate cyclodeaminase